MGWLQRRRELKDATGSTAAEWDGLLPCASCTRVLDGDPDEDPTGNAGWPICGECARERDLFVMDIADGELDGEIA